MTTVDAAITQPLIMYGVAVAQVVERLSSNWEIGGSIPVHMLMCHVSCVMCHVSMCHVSLGKTFNPKLLPLLRQRCVNDSEWLKFHPDEQIAW